MPFWMACWPVALATGGGATGIVIGVDAMVAFVGTEPDVADDELVELPCTSFSISLMICTSAAISAPSCAAPRPDSRPWMAVMKTRSDALVAVDRATAAL